MNSDDFKFFLPSKVDETAEGGGLPTATPLVNGQSNQLFPPISETVSTVGGVSLRKLFVGTDTTSSEMLLGGNVIISSPPEDEKINVVIFETGVFSDNRAAARANAENYLSSSVLGRWALLGDHIAGQRMLQLHCTADTRAPDVNKTICLRSADGSKQQYVRVVKITERQKAVKFDDAAGTFERDIITLELGSKLDHTFAAGAVDRKSSTWTSPPTLIYQTYPADAAEYYGISPLKQAAALGDMKLKATSIYTQIVPSTRAEAAIVDARCVSSRVVMTPIDGAAVMTISRAVGLNFYGFSVDFYFPMGILPGSFSTNMPQSPIDNLDGKITSASGWVSGIIDYAAGHVRLDYKGGLSGGGVYWANAMPAVATTQASQTTMIDVTVENRGYTYTKALSPIPAPGATEVSYLAGGKWYNLLDQGDGSLSGDEGAGVGDITAAGSLRISLGALPDIGSKIVISHGTRAHYESHSGTGVFSPPKFRLSVPSGGFEPGSVSIEGERDIHKGRGEIITGKDKPGEEKPGRG